MNSAFEILVGAIGAAACWALWFFLYKEHRIAAFREEIFTLRDNLFLLAADGCVSFDHPAYVELRNRLNALCRFAHHVSLPTLVIATRYYQGGPQTNDVLLWHHSLANLPQSERQALEQLHGRMTKAFTRYLIEGSVTLMALTSMYAVSLTALKLVRSFFKPRAARIDIRERVLLSMADTLDITALENRAYASSLADHGREWLAI